MSIAAFAALAAFTLLCVFAAQRLAASQGRKPVPWMVAATIFGPLPLIPLALMNRHHA